MSYYRTCSSCGAFLDPGEKCDCNESEKRNENKKADNAAKNINFVANAGERESWRAPAKRV